MFEKKTINNNKCIIIDFDHTIGYFKQIIYLLNIIEQAYKTKLSLNQYFLLLDFYPHIFRPKIYDLFNLILSNKKNIKIFVLYTCNKNKDFVHKIIQFIKYKLKTYDIIFDYILFHDDKTLVILKQFIKNLIDDNTIYCYIDNKKYINMTDKNLKYIHCQPYMYHYSINEIIKHFPYKHFNKITKSKLKRYFEKYFQKNASKKEILPRSTFILSSIKLTSLLNEFIII